MADFEDARARMIAKRFGGNQNGASTGGGGSTRRKKKTVHKTPNNDDKKLTTALKKLGVSPIPGIEEANLFQTDGSVIHFTNPKVQASLQSNTYVISGNGETKQIQDLFPGILSQMGPENVNVLRQLMGALAAQSGQAAPTTADEEEIPQLEGNFEDASK